MAFYQRTVHPNGIILGVTGDFDKTSMLALLREVFGDWAKATVPDIVIPAVPETDFNAGAVRFVNKDTSQTHLRVGHLTIKETDPDYVAVAIANDILGGSSFRTGFSTMCGRNAAWLIPWGAAFAQACTIRAYGSCAPKPNSRRLRRS